MKKNTASQSTSARVKTLSDGTDFSGTVTVQVTVDNGTKTAGGGTVVSKGGGTYLYLPTQAETNGDRLVFSFDGTGALGVDVVEETVNHAAIADVQGRVPPALTADGNMKTDVKRVNGVAINGAGTALSPFGP